MTRLGRWLASAGAAIVVATATHHAEAFCRTTTCNPKKQTCRTVESCARTGAPISWTVMPIPYRFHGRAPERLDRDEARGVIRLAFARWTEVVCSNGRRTSLRFQEGAEIPAAMPRGKEPFGIYFRDDGWPHADADETLALTTHLFGHSGGEIRYADIEINSGEKEFTLRDTEKGTDLEAVMTHEVGHYIGLAHSPDLGSIMTTRYCQSGARCTETKELARDLGADDVEAVCALYPSDGTWSTSDPESGGCTVTRAAADRSGEPLAAAGLLFALCVVALRRRLPALERGAAIALVRAPRIGAIAPERTRASAGRARAVARGARHTSCTDGRQP